MMVRVPAPSVFEKGKISGIFPSTIPLFCQWPDDERWELIDGVAYNMCAAPRLVHQSVAGDLYGTFREYLKGKPCRVFIAPVDVFFPRVKEQDEDDVDTVVQPDVAVVCDPDKLREKGIWGAPDLVVEVLSPSTSRKDLREKYDLYQRSGVREYWVVDPKGHWLQQYLRGDDGLFAPEVTLDGTGTLECQVVPGLVLDVASLWTTGFQASMPGTSVPTYQKSMYNGRVASKGGFPDSELTPEQRLLIQTAAQQFQEATGVTCLANGVDGRALEGESQRPGCRFCRKTVELELKVKQECLTVHRYGAYQAERFGGRYIYFCPSSMTHWAVPVFLHGHVVANLIGGPILLIDPEEYMQEELRVPRSLPPGLLADLRVLLQAIPYIDPSRVTALSETLFRVAASLSVQLAGDKGDPAADTTQSSRIAEYIHELKQSTEGQRDARYPVQKERELIALIAKGDKINSQKVLNEILGFIFFTNGNDVPRIRIRVQELVVLLSRAALEGGASIEEVFGLNNNYLLQLQRMNDVDDIAAWLARILKRFSDCVFNLKSVKHADLIQKAIHFMNANYGRKIGLQDVADHVHMSPSHFSKVFKDEMGKSFVDYLGGVRIDKSKILLRERNIPLIDVAGMVGFDDQSYFSKVFKRFTGQSPGRYRESRGQGDGADIEIHE